MSDIVPPEKPDIHTPVDNPVKGGQGKGASWLAAHKVDIGVVLVLVIVAIVALVLKH